MSNVQKRKIMDAAGRVLLRKGVSGATMDDIAAEAGMSRRGLSHYYPGKTEIILDIIRHYEECVAAARDKLLGDLPDRPFSFFRATILAMLEQMHPPRDDMPFFGGLLDVPELRGEVVALKRRMFSEVCQAYPFPDRVAMAFLLVDGLAITNQFEGAVYYDGCAQALMKGVLEYLDFIENAPGSLSPNEVCDILRNIMNILNQDGEENGAAFSRGGIVRGLDAG